MLPEARAATCPLTFSVRQLTGIVANVTHYGFILRLEGVTFVLSIGF